MRSYLSKWFLILMCLAFVSVPLPAVSAPLPLMVQSSCATVLTPTLSTNTVSPGTNVGVFSRITNCSPRKKSYTVVVSSTSSCGAETIIASNRISFGGNETKLISVSYPVAADTCTGSATVRVSVSDGGVVLASETTTLNVQ